MADDGQAQAEPAIATRRGAIGLPESVEDVRQKLRIDALPRISYRDFDAGVHAFEGDRDSAALWRKLDGIGEYVPHDLLQPVRVSGNETGLGFDPMLDRKSVG